ELEEAKAALQSIKIKVIELQAEKRASESELRNARIACKELDKKLVNVLNELKKAQDKSLDAGGRVTQLESELSNARIENRKLANENVALETEVAKLRAALNQPHAQQSSLTEALQTAAKLREELESERKKARDRSKPRDFVQNRI